VLQFEYLQGVSLLQVLDSFGQVPLPPYITNSQGGSLTVSDGLCPDDRGANSWATFTPQLLSQLQERGIGSVFVTLHVGVGTFRLCR